MRFKRASSAHKSRTKKVHNVHYSYKSTTYLNRTCSLVLEYPHQKPFLWAAWYTNFCISKAAPKKIPI